MWSPVSSGSSLISLPQPQLYLKSPGSILSKESRSKESRHQCCLQNGPFKFLFLTTVFKWLHLSSIICTLREQRTKYQIPEETSRHLWAMWYLRSDQTGPQRVRKARLVTANCGEGEHRLEKHCDKRQNRSLEILLLQKMEEPDSHGDSEKKWEKIGWLVTVAHTKITSEEKSLPSTEIRRTSPCYWTLEEKENMLVSLGVWGSL